MKISLIIMFFVLTFNIYAQKKVDVLEGKWIGKIHETSALLIFKKQGIAYIKYFEFDKKISFKYLIVNDSILKISRNNIISYNIFKITNNTLSIVPVRKKNELNTSIDLIYEILFYKEYN
jgi:hypothetical protein